MSKDELMEIVERMSDDADLYEIETVDDLISKALDMQFLLIMRASYRLRDCEARRPRRYEPDDDDDDEEEEEW